MTLKTWEDLTDGERETLLERLRHSWDAGLNANGPEKWHDALTRYTELERRVNHLEHELHVLEGTLHNFMGRFANKA